MTKDTYIEANSQRGLLQVEAFLEGLGEAADTAVLIVPSLRHVARHKKRWAGRPFLFGLTVTTFPLWVADRWALYGDGRATVSPLQRGLMLHRALSRLIGQGRVRHLGLTPGTVTLLSSIVQEAFTLLLDRQAIHAASPALTEAEEEVCLVLREYADALDASALCEYTQVMDGLLGMGMALPPIVIEGFDGFSYAEERFIEGLASRTTVQVVLDEASLSVKADGRSEELIDLQQCIFDPDPDDPVRPTGAVQFLLPAGQYGKALLVGQAIIGYAEAKLAIAQRKSTRRVATEGDTPHFVVSAHDPLGLFQQLAPFLSAYGIDVTATARKPFSSTDFGKAFLAFLEFLNAPDCPTFKMSDFALSPFSGVSQQKAYDLDGAWRGDRTTDRHRCLEDLSRASSRGRLLVDAFRGEGALGALDIFEGAVKREFSWDEAYRSEQLAAIGLARQFFLAADAVGALDAPGAPGGEPAPGIPGGAGLDVLSLLAEGPVDCSRRTPAPTPDGAQDAPVIVDIMPLGLAADRDACSCHTLIVCDLETFSYPVRDAADAKTLLFEKLGVPAPDSALDKARRQFFRLLSTPVKRLACERVLNTADADPAYPAVMLEELLDCYRSDLGSFDDIDKQTGLPKVLLGQATCLGEDRLYEDLAISEGAQPMAAIEELPPQGIISEVARTLIVLPRQAPSSQGAHAPEADAPAPLALSPSAIESYLECPHKWFSLRRLRLQEPDAGFGPLEMGSFSHSVLKAFYQAFQKQGSEKVDAKNLEEAKGLLARLFDEHLSAQATLKRNDNPLIPLSPLEEAAVAALKRRLLDFLGREAALLPGFVPRYLEKGFGANEGFTYAGCSLYGTIDRVDVNPAGQAVVIDYKSSLTKDYILSSASGLPWADAGDGPGSAVSLPHKVQALIYAQAVRKTLGLEVVGAVYVSYGRDGKVMGAIDSTVLGPGQLPGIDGEACSAQAVGAQGFGDLLDTVEASAAQALERLAAGYIAPYPRGVDPCGYCPVSACEWRRR